MITEFLDYFGCRKTVNPNLQGFLKYDFVCGDIVIPKGSVLDLIIYDKDRYQTYWQGQSVLITTDMFSIMVVPQATTIQCSGSSKYSR
jgi:hypothetical protein